MVDFHINYAPETCATCGGNGRYNGTGSCGGCHVCDGQGSILVAQPARKCATCSGNGRYNGTGSCGGCHACGGSGWAHAFRG